MNTVPVPGVTVREWLQAEYSKKKYESQKASVKILRARILMWVGTCHVISN